MILRPRLQQGFAVDGQDNVFIPFVDRPDDGARDAVDEESVDQCTAGGKAHGEGVTFLGGRHAPQHGITEVLLRVRPREFGSLDGGQVA